MMQNNFPVFVNARLHRKKMDFYRKNRNIILVRIGSIPKRASFQAVEPDDGKAVRL